MSKLLCPDCHAEQWKGHWCPTCISHREATSGGILGSTPLGGQAGPKRGRGRRSKPPSSENVGVTPAAQNVNIHVAPSSRAGPIAVRRNPVKLEVGGDGAIAVDCSCGCGRKVYLKPAYYSTACRSRAWRKSRVKA